MNPNQPLIDAIANAIEVAKETGDVCTVANLESVSRSVILSEQNEISIAMMQYAFGSLFRLSQAVAKQHEAEHLRLARLN